MKATTFFAIIILTLWFSVTSAQTARNNSEYKAIDFTIGVVGDSFISGEGTPDKQSRQKSKVEWACKCCHQSEQTFVNIALDSLQTIFEKYTLTYRLKNESCTGGVIQSPMNQSQVIQQVWDKRIKKWERVGECEKKCKCKRKKRPPQLYLVKDWMETPSNNYDSLDILIVWAGGNDIISLGDIIKKLFLSKFCLIRRIPKNKRIKRKVNQKILQLPESLRRLKHEINSELKPKNVIIFTYPLLIHDANGEFCADLCPSWKGSDCKWLMNEVLEQVNKEIRQAAKDFGWVLIDLEKEKIPGMCAENSFFTKSLKESRQRQGDIRGYAHPNEKFHNWLGKGLLYEKMDSILHSRSIK